MTKLCGKLNWFNKRGKTERGSTDRSAKGKGRKRTPETEGILYIPYTPGSRLKKMIQKQEDLMVGKKLKNQVSREDGPHIGRIALQPNPLEWGALQ